MALRISPLAGARGNLYAHLFENHAVGIERGLYWSMTLPCEPIQWEEEQWETSVTCEWVQWPVGDWTQLDGVSLGTAVHPELVECSFYLAEHNHVENVRVRLERVKGTSRFRAHLGGTLDIDGFGEIDAKAIELSVDGEVEFEGLVVVPDNLSPKPASASEATDALAKFIDVSNLDSPEWDRFRYVFPPTGDA